MAVFGVDRAQKSVQELSELQTTQAAEVAAGAITVPVTVSHVITTDPVALADLIGTLKHRVEELERRSEWATQEKQKSNEAVTRTLKQLACGGLAGAAARTTVAPLDRVKILKQTQFISYVESIYSYY
jgi:hypothetical protein